MYLRDGSLATVRATILRASGWPAEEEGNNLKRERQIFQRQETWKKGALKQHIQKYINNRSEQQREDGEDRLTSHKVEDELKLILVEVGWGDNGSNQTERGLF